MSVFTFGDDFEDALANQFEQTAAISFDGSAYRIREFIVLENCLRSSPFLSTRAFQRRSLPSKERMSNATKQGSARWKSRSLNWG